MVKTVTATLSVEFGRGFGKRNLYNMMRFAKVFPDGEIVHALRAQLTSPARAHRAGRPAIELNLSYFDARDKGLGCKGVRPLAARWIGAGQELLRQPDKAGKTDGRGGTL